MKITKEILIEKFIVNAVKIDEIAKEFNCSRTTIRRKLRIFGIRKRAIITTPKPGDKFGSWEVIKQGPNSGKHRTWTCKCGCGRISNVATGTLNTYNLGCRICNLKRFQKKGVESNNFKGYGELGLTYFNNTAENAKSRNLEFNLKIEDVWFLFLKQERKCALTGLILTFDNLPKNQTASIDRIDSSKGYTLDNIQWIHKDLNYMKMDYTQEEFIKYCHLVAKTHPEEIK